MARRAKPSRNRAPKNEKGARSSSPSDDENNNPDSIFFILKLPCGSPATLSMSSAVMKEEGSLVMLFYTINDLPGTWYMGNPLLKYKGRVLKSTDRFNATGFKTKNTIEVSDSAPEYTGVSLRRHMNRLMSILSSDYNRGGAVHCRSGLSEFSDEKDIPPEKNVNYAKELTDSSQLITKAYDLNYWGLRGFKELYYSSFNPPLPRDYNLGHLAYLDLVTLEDVHYSITGCIKGFYINKIKGDHFDPEIHPSHPKIYTNLIELLCDLSPAFPPIFEKAHEVAKIVVSAIPMYPPPTWYSIDQPNMRCAMRSEFLGYMSGFFQYDDGLMANFDFSATVANNHALGAPGTEDVLNGSMSIFFYDNLCRTARRLFDGEVLANQFETGQEYQFNNFRMTTITNPNDWAIALNQRKMSIFLHHVHRIPNEKVFPLVTGVVKYRGKRAIGMSIPPVSAQGFYNGTTVGAVNDQFYVDDLYVAKLFGDQINMPEIYVPNTVNIVGGKTAEIYGHHSNRIVTISDNVSYAFPGEFSTVPDPNFRENGKVTPLMRSLGFPKKFRHDYAEFRHTAIHRLSEFRSFALFKIQQVITSHDSAKINLETLPQLADACLDEVILGRKNAEFLPILNKVRDNLFGSAEILEEKYIRELLNNKTVMRSLLNGFREGSQKKIIDALKSFVPKNSTLPYYDVRVNPNAYESKEYLVASTDKNEKMNIAAIGEFIATVQIPTFIYLYFLDENNVFDNEHLLEFWKKRQGINTRYLGLLVKGIEGIEVLSELKKLAISEMLMRSTKHIFNTLIEPTDRTKTSKAVSHFLNCLLGSVQNGETSKSRENAIFTLDSSKLFVLVSDDMSEHFDFDVKVKSFAELFSVYGIQKLPVLRRVCLLTGIVLTLKDYDLTCNAPIALVNVVDVAPVVKGFDFESVVTHENYSFTLEATNHRSYIDSRVTADYTYRQQESSLGPNVADVGFWMLYSSKLSFRIGAVESFDLQLRATEIVERTLGPCHFKTVYAYFFTALIATLNKYYNTALKLLLRVHRMTRLLSSTNGLFVAFVELLIGLILSIHNHPDTVAVLDMCAARRSKCIKNFDTYLLPSIAGGYSWHREFRKAMALYRAVLAENLNTEDRKYFEKQFKACVSDAVKLQRSLLNNNELRQVDFDSFDDVGAPADSIRPILYRLVNGVVPDLFEPFTVSNVSDYYRAIHGQVDAARARKKIHRKIRSFS